MSEYWQATDDRMKTFHLSASDPQTHTHTPPTLTDIAEISIVNAYWAAVWQKETRNIAAEAWITTVPRASSHCFNL